jgi:hypothetical protein
MLGQGANVMESLNRSALDMAQLEQQYRASALGLGAQQEMQGRGAQQSLMAQNVAGLAQREMQAQMEQNQIMQDTVRNLAYMGMNGGFEGMFAKKGGVLDTNTLNQVNQIINTPLELKTTPISSGNTGNTNAGNTGSETTSGLVNSILSTPIGGVLNAIPSNNIGTTQMQETSITDNVDFQNWLSSQNIQVPFGVPQDVFMNKMYEQYLAEKNNQVTTPPVSNNSTQNSGAQLPLPSGGVAEIQRGLDVNLDTSGGGTIQRQPPLYTEPVQQVTQPIQEQVIEDETQPISRKDTRDQRRKSRLERKEQKSLEKETQEEKTLEKEIQKEERLKYQEAVDLERDAQFLEELDKEMKTGKTKVWVDGEQNERDTYVTSKDTEESIMQKRQEILNDLKSGNIPAQYGVRWENLSQETKDKVEKMLLDGALDYNKMEYIADDDWRYLNDLIGNTGKYADMFSDINRWYMWKDSQK